MKKGWKIFWITCGIIAAIGLVLCVIGVGLGATVGAVQARFPNGIGLVDNVDLIWFDDEYEPEYEDGETTSVPDDRQSFRGIREVEVDVSRLSLQIMEQNDGTDDIRVETSNVNSRLGLRYYQGGDELEITTKKNLHNISSGGTVWLYLPKDRLTEVNISMKAGRVYIQNLNADSFGLDVGAGEGVIDQFSAAEADLNCGAGRLEAFGVFSRELDIDCGTGEIELTMTGRKQDYNYDVDCGIGEVESGCDSYAGIGVRKQESNQAMKEMNIDCGVGRVAVSFIDNKEE